MSYDEAILTELDFLRFVEAHRDVLIVDDFGPDAIGAIESRDAHEILAERGCVGSIVITSSADPTSGSVRSPLVRA